MKNIVIYGAGGLGREVLWLINSINAQSPTWNVLGFLVDKDFSDIWGTEVNSLPVLGDSNWLSAHKNEIYVTCAIGNSSIRKAVYEKVSKIENVKLATLIDPSVRVDHRVYVGEGSIICYNCIVTIDIIIGKGVLLNTGTSIGHDAVIGNYCTFFMSTMAAGNTKFGECCEIGSGAFIMQGKSIVSNAVVAPLSAVLRDVDEPGIYSGNPARRIK